MNCVHIVPITSKILDMVRFYSTLQHVKEDIKRRIEEKKRKREEKEDKEREKKTT